MDASDLSNVVPRVECAPKQDQSHSIVDEEQSHGSLHLDEARSSGHLAQVQQSLASASACLHRDVYAASSPASSIGSRLTMDATGAARSLFSDAKEYIVDSTTACDQVWRYSYIPRTLATPKLDVREPLPPPVLPDSYQEVGAKREVSIEHEPLSSGYSSPMHPNSALTRGTSLLPCPVTPNSNILNCLLAQSHRSIAPQTSLLSDQLLEHRRSFCDDSEPYCDRETGPERLSATKDHQNQPENLSAGITPSQTIAGSIYMSESAQAAGENAKAKRQLFVRDPARCTSHSASRTALENYPDLMINQNQNQILHYEDVPIERVFTPAGPAQLVQQKTSFASLTSRNTSSPRLEAARNPGFHSHQQYPYTAQGVLLPRATATGSPLPVGGAQVARPSAGYHYLPQMQPTLLTSGVRGGIDNIACGEHFQPGWYYAPERFPQQSPLPVYSFSTAASKAIGSDQAPDSRMRDSYKTDTLTALPRPTNRFRKNGIGAAVPTRGVSRFYVRQDPSHSLSAANHPPYAGRRHPARPDVQFTSSPPRGSAYTMYSQVKRKRAANSTTVFTDPDDEQDSIRGLKPALVTYNSDKVFSVDENTKAAVRMSILENAATPTMTSETELRELSPNVVATRKSVSRAGMVRKKRRPSYWDSDLEEIRESPAVKRGVNSPFSAQQSMKADVETASMDTVEVRPEAYFIGQAKSMENGNGQKTAHAPPFDPPAGYRFETDDHVSREDAEMDGLEGHE